jgi:hypothetical protein
MCNPRGRANPLLWVRAQKSDCNHAFAIFVTHVLVVVVVVGASDEITVGGAVVGDAVAVVVVESILNDQRFSE